MTTIEDRLRDALGADIDVPDLLSDVRRGARRRRARRTTGVVAVAAIAVVTGIGVTATLTGSDGSSPHPAPSPTAPTPTDGAIPAARPGAVALEAANGKLFRLAWHEACCTNVQVREDDAWTQLHLFDEQFDKFEMGPDGLTGFVWGQELWATYDGGVTWQRPKGPRPSMYGFRAGFTADAAWVQSHDRDGLGQLWRSPLATDDWARVEAPDGDLVVLGNTVALQTSGEGLSDARLEVRDVATGDWSPSPLCASDAWVIAVERAAFHLCYTQFGNQLYRSTDLLTWEPFGPSDVITGHGYQPLGPD
ncbi:MAG TPA: hypothetical protein VLI04_20855, partial [Nocardioidaceae bacterium]|nr:hypothetical protein [Nocardioidaceae bacterium]